MPAGLADKVAAERQAERAMDLQTPVVVVRQAMGLGGLAATAAPAS